MWTVATVQEDGYSMKKFWLLAVAVTLFMACTKKDDTPKLDVTGAWELSSVATKATVGSETVSVYVDFASAGSFTLYQKIGNGRYTVFTGTYTLDATAGKLSGKYNGGKAWGPYSAAMEGSNLTLTSDGGKEVDTYKKIDAIPESVKNNIY